VHTLKGSALGLDHVALAEACHALESAWDAGQVMAVQQAEQGLRALWLQHVELATLQAPLRVADLEAAVEAFFTRSMHQLGIPATLHCRLAPAWLDEQALLWDVLPHLLRNALVHGQEPVATRQAAGKPERLQVWVRGHAGAGRLRLLVADDGAGVRRQQGAPDLWSGRGMGVAAVRAAVAGRGLLQWRSRPGRGGVARICLFLN
jgi:nitrate/nitrite-specific signal transduction histidine kinase